MINSKKAMIACDLDGSLISINSYKHWIYFNLLFAAVTFQFQFIAKLFFEFAKKHTKRSTRWEVKKALIRAAHKSTVMRWGSRGLFQTYLQLFVRRRLLEFVKELQSQSGAPAYIVTAAWEGYCDELAGKYGFDGIIASGTGDGNENLGVQKVESIHELFGKDVVIIALTDHHDDLPLAKAADTVFLVTPSLRSLGEFERSGIEFSVLQY